MNKYIQENVNIKLFPDGWDMALSVEKMETASDIVFTTENGANEFRRVKHGEWIDESYTCSECGESLGNIMDADSYFRIGFNGCNFCPHCGADMRGETNG